MAALIEEKEKEQRARTATPIADLPKKPDTSTFGGRMTNLSWLAGNRMGDLREGVGLPREGYGSFKGIPEFTPKPDAQGGAGFIGDANASPQKPSTVSSIAKPKTPTITPKAKPLLNNPWQMSGTPVQSLGSGFFASGQQGDNFYQWGRDAGKETSNVFLPEGVSPENLSKEELAKYGMFSESKGDTGRDVTVIRGLREFKGGKEKEDSMTRERQLQQSVTSAISSLATAQDQGVNPAAASGIISGLSRDQSGIEQAEIAADAAVKAATQKAVTAGAKVTVANIKTRRPDPNNPFNQIEESVPIAIWGSDSRDYMFREGTVEFRKGNWIFPEAWDEAYKKYMLSVIYGIDIEEENK